MKHVVIDPLPRAITQSGRRGLFGSHRGLQVQEPIEDPVGNCTSNSELWPDTPGYLLKTVQTLGLRRNHTQLDGMMDALKVVVSMAEGTAEARVYLSSLDPGVGKTLTAQVALQRMAEAEDHDHVGVVVFVSTLNEIAGLVEGAGLSKADFAVFTKNDDVNGLSSTPAAEAQILFTTQQMLRSRCGDGLFADCADFYYRGKPRSVRIWDETLDPGEVVTLSSYDLGGLLTPLSVASPEVAKELEALQLRIKEAELGEVLDVPEVGSRAFAVSERASLTDQQHRYLDNLVALSGRSVKIVEGSYGHRIALDIRDSIPTDLAPLLVLDASGRVRQTYHLWETEVGGLVRLKTAPKSYEGLTINVLDQGGGKDAWKREGDRLAMEVASVINAKPDEDWLVIHHKDAGGVDPKKEILSRIQGDRSRVHFVNWGAHKATNDFKTIRNVILAGTLFKPASYYEGMTRASLGLAVDEPVLDEELKRVRLGEYGHDNLQALCRSSVRVGEPCEAYVIAAKRSGIRAALPDWFPGCRVKTWKPRHLPLKGRMRRAIAFLRLQKRKRPGNPVPFAHVMKVVDEADTSNFRKLIRDKPAFKMALERLGLEEVSTNRKQGNNAFGPIWDIDPEAAYTQS